MRRILLACTLLLASCAAADTATAPQYLGQWRVPAGATLEGTVIGGLSGISYDAGRDLYYIVSDDRSAKNPARFYTVRISLSDSGIDGVEFVSTHPWLDEDGREFAPLNMDAHPSVVPPDAEGIAVDTRRQRLYWSSEGERRDAALLDPWVRIADPQGRYIGEFTMPPGFEMSSHERGPRRNSGLEGLTLTPDGRSLFAAMEGPRYEDGAPPDGEHGALTRITKFDVETRNPVAQYAYPLDRVSAGPEGDNGLSDLVALDDETFLAVEGGYGLRAASRLYRVSVGEADDVLTRPTLDGATAMTKTLLADLSTTQGLSPLDNIEGVTLGPTLPDGRQSVVMVSDDNFSPTQTTQFLAFAL
ncbi:esterase-like activity of phytase family protein [Mycobacterium hubeiense]|uniref:esterase-like activity of phytase family protein n=1 Tax=Mycobacterium hubeiense TaxID=1867256 RepID=UPI000C7F6AB7|nr:esterase-like activity of phytase family protein [Mycobacterium sp. QGD 101]